jgi:hypothetical protein
LKKFYATAAEIPAGLESYYKEQDGKFVRDDSQIEGIPAGDSVTKLTDTLKKVRGELTVANQKLTAFGSLTAEEATAAVLERDDLKLKLEAGGAKPDAAAVAELVKTQVALKTGPLDKRISDLTAKVTAAESERDSLKTARKQDQIQMSLRDAAVKAGVLPEAIPSILALKASEFDVNDENQTRTREMNGVVPGLDPMAVINDMKATHPFFWATSQGGGAQGGAAAGASGSNPWKAENWNLTAQGKIMTTDMAKAKALATAAGVDVHAVEPKKA